MLTVFPKVSEEWDYEKNDSLKPELLLPKSGKIVWWKCPKGHSYQASIIYRTTKGGGCPYCSHQKLLSGFNDLQTLYPDTLTEWDYSKNDLPPNQYMAHVAKKVWWLCPAGHSYNMTIAAHTSGRRCPICAQATHTSFPEQAIYYYLKQVYPDVINAYRKYKSELDLFIPSIETAIEYDGESFHKNTKRDELKAELCSKNGVELIRIREPKCP
ncbi:MAG: hypothetical protein II181_01875, partial [Firmicutes bacterium]|nr:hypothetical protein [Bacillota bacterium]